jgi:hypothetical protein
VVDLIGKGGHIRTVPIPQWVTAALDQWTVAAAVSEGQIFRAVARTGEAGETHLAERCVLRSQDLARESGPRAFCTA